jgi:hypothetical protein
MCVDGECGLGTIPPPQIRQSQQAGQERSCPTADVEEMDLTVEGLFNGSSLGMCVDGMAVLIC